MHQIKWFSLTSEEMNHDESVCNKVFACNRFNTINHITDVSFRGLRSLELLMMHGNNVQNIPDGAFEDLVSLQVK